MGMRSIAIEWSGSRLMASLAWATFHNGFILRIRVNHQAAAQLGGVRFLAFAVRGEGKSAEEVYSRVPSSIYVHKNVI
jgi:hypothetical protein